MKTKIFTLIACMMLSLSMAAQDYLMFNNIPITGNIESFCLQLTSKGFTQTSVDHNSTYFTGCYNGRRATVRVVATDDGKNVHGVVVRLSASSEWAYLVDTYKQFKQIFTYMYGSPRTSLENNPSDSEDNLDLMTELYQGSVQYGCMWIVKGGIVDIYISKTDELLEGRVIIRFLDSTGADAIKQEAKQAAQQAKE